MNSTTRKNATRILAASLLAGAIGVAHAADPQAQERSGERATGENQSEQPVGDTWITTKVKAQLLANEQVSGLDISVETVNGVVHLSGDVETRAEADHAIAIARDIEGVVSVDSSDLNVSAAAGSGTE